MLQIRLLFLLSFVCASFAAPLSLAATVAPVTPFTPFTPVPVTAPDTPPADTLRATPTPAVSGSIITADGLAVPTDAFEEAAGIEDEGLEQQIRNAFAAIPGFVNVTVAVRNGVVLLRGRVPRTHLIEDARGVASQFGGVVYVVNSVERETELEDTVAPVINRIRGYTVEMIARLPIFGIAMIVFMLFWFLARFARGLELPFRRMQNPLLKNLLRQVISTAILIIGVLLALDLLDATALVTAMLGGAGVVGLAIGFAFRDIAENYIAGILLSLRQPFAVNDHVKIREHEGRIIRLTPREMILMTLDGNHIRVPNATVFTSVIYNYTRNPRRQFRFVVGVGNDEDLSEVQRLGLDTLRSLKGVLETPGPGFGILELADFSVQVQFVGWVDQREADFGKVRTEAIRLVKEVFDKSDIDMPEPTSTVRIERLKRKETKGTRRPEVPELRREAQTVDISPDTTLDEQVAEDLALSSEENLLDKKNLEA